ncbi:MAG: O-antigen ligase family protein [Gemmatimonadetes bacterium]|nr:O-antigen ligase family protein [Gemmatimonadota bacterium]
MTTIADSRLTRGTSRAIAYRAPPPVPEANRLVRWAFYLFVFSIPFEMPQGRTIPLEIPTLTASVFLLSTLLDLRACYQRIPAAVVLFGGWLWVFVVSLLVNPPEDTGQVVHYFGLMLQMALVFWTGGNLMRDPRVLHTTLLVLVTACSLRAALQLTGVGLTARRVWTGGERESLLGQNANLSALILSAGLLAALGLRSARERSLLRRHLVIWSLVVLLGGAIVQTGSRGGLLALTVGLLVFLFRGRTMWQRLGSALAVCLVMGFLTWAAFNTRVMRERFEATAENRGSLALAGRERIYPAVLGMIGERPVLGWGPINNQIELARRLAERVRPRKDVHNLVLELLSATGVLGTIPFLTGLGLCIGTAWRARRDRYGILPCAMLASILIGTMSGTWIASKILWLILAIALASPSPQAEKWIAARQPV